MEQVQNLDLSPMSAVGAALLRFILAGFWITHWWFKVGYRGMPATEAFFLQHGLPLSSLLDEKALSPPHDARH